MKKSNLVKIAQIGKTVGLRGDLKLHLHTDFPEQFKKKRAFFKNDLTKLIIENYNPQRGIVKFFGFDDKEDASVLINQFLYTTIEDSQNYCALRDNEYFWFDIIDAKVYQDDLYLGHVIDIQRFDPDDFLVIKTDKNLQNMSLPKQFLIPYIKRYIVDFDKNSKTIHTQDTLDLLKSS